MGLKRELFGSKLKRNDDQDIWITKLEKINWELENNHSDYITEEDFVTQIIILLPQEYDILYNSLQLQINNSSDPLSLDKLRKQFCWHYEKMIKPKVRDNCVHLSENSHEKYGKSGNRNSNGN